MSLRRIGQLFGRIRRDESRLRDCRTELRQLLQEAAAKEKKRVAITAKKGRG